MHIPSQIGFDIDGVVTDTMEAFLRIANIEYGITGITKEQITSYWLEECLPIPEEIVDVIIQRILHDPFGIDLKPIPGALETLNQLGQKNKLIFVTARPVGEPIANWLKTQLPEVDNSNIEVYATSTHAAKANTLNSLNITWFIEDHLETCKSLASHGIKTVLYDQPWNQGNAPFLRVKSWAEIKKLLSI